MPTNILYDVTVDNGKYRFVYQADGFPLAFRHGEPWPVRAASMVGDKAMMALVAELSDTRDLLATATHNLSVVAGPPASEMSSEHPRFSPIVGVVAQVEVPLERVVNCIIGAIENGYSPWMHAFVHTDTPATVAALAESKDPADPMIWYARETFWRAGGQAQITFDREDDDEGDGGGTMSIGYVDFVRGLSLMASKAPRHFADLVAENDDAVTHDVFMQMVVLGDIVYG